MQYAEIGMRCLIGTVFLAAAVSKLAGRRSFAAFAGSITELNVLPPALTRWAAIAVVCGECLVCLLLLVPTAPAAVLGFTGAGVLLVLFAVVIGRVVAAGGRTACRCFGASTVPLGVRHIVRNAVLAGLAAAGAAAARHTGPVHPAGLVLAALSGVLAGGLVIALDTVVDLFRPVRSKA